MSITGRDPISGGGGPIGVFFSYAHEDNALRDKLVRALAAAEQEKVVRSWWDREIPLGTDYEYEIDKRLRTAQIVLALYSPDFFMSDYCRLELRFASTRQNSQKAVLLEIEIRPVALPESLKRVKLLKVQGPDASGEPTDNDWKRVAESIIDCAMELTNRRHHAVPSSSNLAPRDSTFVGREDLLDEISANLADPRGPRIQALTGRDGVGKEWAAREYAWRHSADYRRIWWIDATHEIGILEGSSAFAEDLKLSAADIDTRLERLRNWLTTSTDWLLVFARAPDPDAIVRFLPSQPGGHVLITSEAAPTNRTIQSIPVAGLTSKEAMAFLIDSGDADLPAARALVEATFGSPAILAAAVAYVTSGTGSLADYLAQLLRRAGGQPHEP